MIEIKEPPAERTHRLRFTPVFFAMALTWAGLQYFTSSSESDQSAHRPVPTTPKPYIPITERIYTNGDGVPFRLITNKKGTPTVISRSAVTYNNMQVACQPQPIVSETGEIHRALIIIDHREVGGVATREFCVPTDVLQDFPADISMTQLETYFLHTGELTQLAS